MQIYDARVTLWFSTVAGAALTLLNAGKYASSIIAVWLRYNAVTRSNIINHFPRLDFGDRRPPRIFFTRFGTFHGLTIIEYNPSVSGVSRYCRGVRSSNLAVWAFAVAFNVLAQLAAAPGLPLNISRRRCSSPVSPAWSAQRRCETCFASKRTLFKLWCVPSERRFAV